MYFTCEALRDVVQRSNAVGPHPPYHVNRHVALVVRRVNMPLLVARAVRTPAMQRAVAVWPEGLLIQEYYVLPVVEIMIPVRHAKYI